ISKRDWSSDVCSSDLWTQRRPWLVMIGAIVVLAGLAVPLTHLQLRNTAAEMLPTQSEQREFLQLMTEQYPQATQPEITVVADTKIGRASCRERGEKSG